MTGYHRTPPRARPADETYVGELSDFVAVPSISRDTMHTAAQ